MIINLFYLFFKITICTFGGGFAMVPILQEALSSNRLSLTHRQFSDALGICGILPGPMATNLAVYIGFKSSGLAGVLAALLGIIIPILVVGIVFSQILHKYQEKPFIKSTLLGFRCGVVIIMFLAAVIMFFSEQYNVRDIIVALTAFCMVGFSRINPAIIIIGGGIVGLAIRSF